MHVHIHSPALVPDGKEDTTFAAIMLDVLEGIHHVRDEEEAEREAEGDEGPDAVV